MTGPRRSRNFRRSSRRRQGGYTGHISRARPQTANPANQWVKHATIEQKQAMGGKCQEPGCNETRLSKLEFVHIHETPISRTGPRGRKEKLADVHAHPEDYQLMCHKHHIKNKAAVEHDAEMREKGAREEA